MSTSPTFVRPVDLVYPDSDGKPMADNTLQFRWIVTIKEGLDRLYMPRDDVFVAGDLLWYPVLGHPEIRQAPDALVAFGRPKGYRGSYKQWEEGGIPPQAVFEVLSPGNRPGQMAKKFNFYEKYGVQEYYIYDPDNITLDGFLRGSRRLEPIARMDGWQSPLLGIRFDMTGPELVIYGPDGRPFLTFQEMADERDQASQRAAAEHARAKAEHARAEAEHARAEAERARAERLAAQLRALGIEPPE